MITQALPTSTEEFMTDHFPNFTFDFSYAATEVPQQSKKRSVPDDEDVDNETTKKAKCEGDYCTCTKTPTDNKKKNKELQIIDGQSMPEDAKTRLTKTWVPVNAVSNAQCE